MNRGTVNGGAGQSTNNGPGPGQVTITGDRLQPNHWWWLP